MKRRVLLAMPCAAGVAGLGVGLFLPTTARAAERAEGSVALASGDTVEWPQVRLLDGRLIGPEALAGQAVVVVFFTTSCPFCRRHLAHVQQLHLAAASRPLTVLAVARENDAAKVQRHVRTMGYTFAVTADHQQLSLLLAPRRVVPLTVTIDRSGRLMRALAGEMSEDDTMELLALADTGAPSTSTSPSKSAAAAAAERR